MEREAAGMLAQQCGYLPLALRVAAAQLACAPHRRIQDLTTELRTGGSQFAAPEPGGEQPTPVPTTLALSP